MWGGREEARERVERADAARRARAYAEEAADVDVVVDVPVDGLQRVQLPVRAVCTERGGGGQQGREFTEGCKT